MTIGNPAFCLALDLTSVYFRDELQHVGDVSEQEIKCWSIRTQEIGGIRLQDELDDGEEVESMIKSGKVQNRQTTQGLASFCFFPSKHLFFPVCFFPINLKTLSPVFLISHQYSLTTGSYFYHCDVLWNSELILFSRGWVRIEIHFL